MRITIDNEDGLGAVDYTPAVTAHGPITIQRALNAPSRCIAEILLNCNGLRAPARRGRVVVANQGGTVLFTGYLATEPVPIYAGAGVSGPVYRAQVSAVSDEWLLDRQGSGANAVTNGLALGLDGASLVSHLTQTAQLASGAPAQQIAVATGGSARAVGAFAVQPDANWSTNAASAANASYASYRVVNGAVSIVGAGAVTHTFSDADGSLNVAALSTANIRQLANDVTISGAEEPSAYVQEVFQGDGTTTLFELSEAAFRGTNRTLLRDSFNQGSFDSSQWALSDGGNHLQLTSFGLTLNGGNGYDGQTTLTAASAIEMGGSVLVELGGVVFGAASDGVLAGFYSGDSVLPNCFAGFRVRQSSSASGGVTTVVPVVNGSEAGAAFTPITGHRYTLRLRLFCAEMQRVPQRYYCMVDGAVEEFGTVSGVNAPMQLVFEVLDEGASSNTPATVLYDSAPAGPLSGTPASCTFVAANSTNLYGSMASLKVTRPGSMWVVSTLPNGSQQTRLMGSAGEGVDCRVSFGTLAGSPGKVTFFAGRVPAPGERVTVTYRTEGRSIARLASSASVAAESATSAGVAVPGVSRWLGRVTAPVARSSADCEAAAQAVLAMGTARTASLAGEYTSFNPAQDIWPGDLLAVTSTGVTNSFVVRSVEMKDSHSIPELVGYRVKFANDWATEWADGLGLKLTEAIASDAILPPTAAAAPAQTLPNLQQLTVTGLSGAMVQVDAGLAPPIGGGFEVRRRDWVIGTGTGPLDLVLRSPVRSFSIPRSAQAERFYVRTYDASTQPVYSRYSSAVFVNWPVA